MRRLFRAGLLAGLALGAALAQAAMGLTELPGLKGDGPVTVLYPSDSPAAPVARGPFSPSVALNGHAIAGNRRLIVLSHGSGGAPWVHTDLARALVEAGFVVALPEHRGDNYRDASSPGPDSWKLRPAEASRAIDAVGRDARFAPLLDLARVGVVGQSAGGHTALSLAGGRWSPARFLRHCEAHLAQDFNACVGTFTLLTGGLFDGLKQSAALGVLRQRFDDETLFDHQDPRFAAAVAAVPAAADFDPASLAHPRIPLALVTAGRDRWLTPRWHSDAVLTACTPCERIAHLPDGGHSILLSPLPPTEVLGAVERQLLADPAGFDRGVLPDVDRKIAAFFRRHLLP